MIRPTSLTLLLGLSSACSTPEGLQRPLVYLRVDPEQRLEVLETHETHESGVGCLQWQHQGELLLTGAHDHGMHLMARQAGGLVQVGLYPDDGGGVQSARWSPDDRWLARSGSKLDLIQILALEDCGEE